MRFLDSDFIIPLLRKSPAAANKLRELKGEELASTVINEFELLYGAKMLPSYKHFFDAKELFSQLKIFDFTSKAAEKAAEIQADLAKSGNQLDAKDLFIAAIVLQNNGTLVTRNTKHFARVQGLHIEPW